ncbi:MAG TPA: serine/threonine-protein kinase [Kofleriaceae bacterium]|nr:serine/threonine-protein kinase [Kofleriaceae bacterium]
MSQTRIHTGPPIEGSILGSYRILGEISSGGMGAVFRAQHVLLGRPAAVKLLRPDLSSDADLVQRFVNEARAVTACKHPGIVEVYDFGYTDDGRAFYVMELLEGESLARRLGRARLPEIEAAAIALGIASALKAAHKVGVIHRDLKPDNVFLVPDPDGGPDRTKVLDFGIAKLGDAAATPGRRTETGILIGTPLYMAPEQARAASMIDGRADLYSLGCILYHMLVGHPPFLADGAGEIIALQMFGEVEPPSRLAPVSPELERLVLRLLEKEPADRFQSAGELVSALAVFDTVMTNRPTWPSSPAMTGTSDAEPTGRGEVAPAPAPRRRTVPIMTGAVAVAALGGILGFALLRGGAASSLGTTSTEPAPPARSVRAPAPGPAAPPAQLAAPAMPVTTPPAAPAQTEGVASASPSAAAAPAPPAPRPHSRHAAPAHAAKTAARGDATPAAAPAVLDVPDRAIEVIREDRPVDAPAVNPGAHTGNGSPIEVDLSPGTSRTPRARPAPGAPPARQKDPSPP